LLNGRARQRPINFHRYGPVCLRGPVEARYRPVPFHNRRGGEFHPGRNQSLRMPSRARPMGHARNIHQPPAKTSEGRCRTQAWPDDVHRLYRISFSFHQRPGPARHLGRPEGARPGGTSLKLNEGRATPFGFHRASPGNPPEPDRSQVDSGRGSMSFQNSLFPP